MQNKKCVAPVPTESQEQQALFNWIRLSVGKYPELDLAYHIPNEGKRSVANGARLKREGLHTGIPDIHLPVAKGEYHSLYIELKRVKNSKISKEQEATIKKLNKVGNCAVIAYGWDEARKIIEWYLNL